MRLAPVAFALIACDPRRWSLTGPDATQAKKRGQLMASAPDVAFAHTRTALLTWIAPVTNADGTHFLTATAYDTSGNERVKTMERSEVIR